MRKTGIALLCTSFLLVACGYKTGYDGLSSEYRTISVPYVEGDWNGELTNTIIRQISRSGAFEYRNECAGLTLLVKIIDSNDQNIGFRYDRHKDGRLRDTIIPTETRLTTAVEISVIETASGTSVLGPCRLLGSVDFDHDYYSSRNEINVFSLGQLSDYDAANEAAQTPLNEVLAKKIVDYVSDNW